MPRLINRKKQRGRRNKLSLCQSQRFLTCKKIQVPVDLLHYPSSQSLCINTSSALGESQLPLVDLSQSKFCRYLTAFQHHLFPATTEECCSASKTDASRNLQSLVFLCFTWKIICDDRTVFLPNIVNCFRVRCHCLVSCGNSSIYLLSLLFVCAGIR